MDTALRQSVLEQEMIALRADVTTWLRDRRDRDANGRHRSRLLAIEQQITAGLTVASSPPAGADPWLALRVGELYTVALRRAWRFLARPLEQADDPSSAALLAAADEIVWACWGCVRVAAPEHTAAPPAVVIEPWWSPVAIPPELVPPELSAELSAEVGRDFLTRHLNRLSYGLVRVPEQCRRGPWWLALLGHEVGHHVQASLLPNRGMEDAFKLHLHAAAVADGAPPTEAGQWAAWGRELFADLWGVLTLGPASIHAIAAFLAGPPEGMRRPWPTYPPAYTRLAVMAELWQRLGGGALDLGLSDAPLTPRIPAIAQAMLAPLPSLGLTAAELAMADPAEADDAAALADDLVDGLARPTPALPRARVAAAALWGAWRRAPNHAPLAAHGVALVRGCAPVGVRASAAHAAPDPAPDPGPTWDELAAAWRGLA